MYKVSIEEKELNSEKNQLNINIAIDKNKSIDYKKYLKQTLYAFDDFFNYNYVLKGDNFESLMSEKVKAFSENTKAVDTNNNYVLIQDPKFLDCFTLDLDYIMDKIFRDTKGWGVYLSNSSTRLTPNPV